MACAQTLTAYLSQFEQPRDIIERTSKAHVIDTHFQISEWQWAAHSVIERLVDRITVEADGCWIVAGFQNPFGHVKVSDSGEGIWAHRASFAYVNGPMLDGEMVCHHCDRGACLNPAHHFLGPSVANVRDMIAKGRNSPPPLIEGERHAKATLTDAQIREIRGISTSMKQRDVAAAYGCSQSSVWRFLHKKTRRSAEIAA